MVVWFDKFCFDQVPPAPLRLPSPPDKASYSYRVVIVWQVGNQKSIPPEAADPKAADPAPSCSPSPSPQHKIMQDEVDGLAALDCLEDVVEQVTKRTLVILDPEGTCFGRAWCLLEHHTAVIASSRSKPPAALAGRGGSPSDGTYFATGKLEILPYLLPYQHQGHTQDLHSAVMESSWGDGGESLEMTAKMNANLGRVAESELILVRCLPRSSTRRLAPDVGR